MLKVYIRIETKLEELGSMQLIKRDICTRLHKLERIFSQQVDLKSALDSKDFLLDNI